MLGIILSASWSLLLITAYLLLQVLQSPSSLRQYFQNSVFILTLEPKSFVVITAFAAR